MKHFLKKTLNIQTCYHDFAMFCNPIQFFVLLNYVYCNKIKRKLKA